MAQIGKLGSHLNGSENFIVSQCLITPIYSSRTPSLQGHREHYGGVEENMFWQGTFAKGGSWNSIFSIHMINDPRSKSPMTCLP